MRLTLRTLLAYLDDILDANQTKEIGARVTENNMASSLVARIRDVTRRRRIGSPELSGPGSTPDPNIVAEYLDNTLEPASVADLERVCLESDVHLAEVAACHQILTIVLGEPVTIRPELRERMYAMGAVVPNPALSNSTPTAPYAVGSAKPIAQRPLVPEYLKRPPLWKTLAPISIVALVLMGAWVYLVGDYFKPDESKPVATQTPSATSKDAAVQPAAPAPASNSENTGEPGALASTSKPMTDVPVILPDLATTDTSAPLPVEPVGEPVAAAPLPVGEPAVAIIPAPPAPGIPAVVEDETAKFPAPTVMYTSLDGVLLHRPRGRQDWMVLPRRALIHVGDEVASPEPFVSELQFASANDPGISLRVLLQGGARIRLLPSTEIMLGDIEINRGRVAISRSADGIDHALGMGVTVNGQRTEFDAVSAQTRFGLMVRLPQPNGPPNVEAWPQPTGTLFVVNGSLNVRRANLPPLSGNPTPEFLEWTNPAADGFTPLTTVPLWLDPDYRVLPSARNWARQYEDQFTLDQPVQFSIVPVVEQDKRATIARYAAQTMALVDDVPSLVRALTSQHEETRHDAIIGLREWMMLSPENGALLEEELNRGFREQEAPVVLKLLRSLSDDEAHDEAASMQLIDWMANENISIRELAFYEAHRFTGKDLQYRPQNSEGQREPAMMRWRDLVKRNKGLVAKVNEAVP